MIISLGEVFVDISRLYIHYYTGYVVTVGVISGSHSNRSPAGLAGGDEVSFVIWDGGRRKRRKIKRERSMNSET